jgi:hypothetical protein
MHAGVAAVREPAEPARLHRHQLPLQLLLRRALRRQVQRRVDGVALRVQGAAQLLLELPPDGLDEVRRRVLRPRPTRSRSTSRPPPPRPLSAVMKPWSAIRRSTRSRPPAPPPVRPRVQPRRRPRQRRQHRRLRQRQLRRVLAEVLLRRRLDAVRAAAEVDLVQVQLDDLTLAVPPLDLPGHPRLADLPP